MTYAELRNLAIVAYFSQFLKDDDTRIVTIPRCPEHEGMAHNKLRIHLNWYCPKCGEKRGTPELAISWDGSRRLHVDGWLNPCGHIDYYADVRVEARRNGLNDE